MSCFCAFLLVDDFFSMLLCVASGSSSSGFTRSGVRCRSQSVLFQNNANHQLMIEERCSMSSSAVDVSQDHVPNGEGLFLDLRVKHKARTKSPNLKENTFAYQSNVIVISGDDTDLSAAEKGETCTTTTFKSSVVNGKRSTNTILVRYKASKVSNSEEDINLESDPHEAACTNSNGSSLSVASSDSASSGKKDKASVSAWAQIMELEGYRSPAIGLDNAPPKDHKNNNSTKSEIFCDLPITLSDDSCKSDVVKNDKPCACAVLSERSSCDKVPKYSNGVCENLCNIGVDDIQCENCSRCKGFTQCNNGNVSLMTSLGMPVQNNFSVSLSKTGTPSTITQTLEYDGKSKLKLTSVTQYEGSGTLRKNYSTKENSCAKTSLGTKSSMSRSESSRVGKCQTTKNRRKTLPDEAVNESKSDILNSILADTQKSPEHDPNASWGRYNSRAMRDTVRKVAEKYAESVYLRRQHRSKLDALPEASVKLTKCVVPSHDQDHIHFTKRGLYLQNSNRIATSTSHLHELPLESKSSLKSRSSLHLMVPVSVSHNHNFPTSCINENQPHDLKMSYKLHKHRSDGVSKINFCKSRPMSDLNFETNNIHAFSSKHDPISCIEKVNNYSEKCEKSANFKIDNSRNVFSASKSSQTSNDTMNMVINKELPSHSCDVNKVKYSAPNLIDIKSKLCNECAQSSDFFLPAKEPSCRTRCREANAVFHHNGTKSSKISLLNQSSAAACSSQSHANHSLHIHSHVTKLNENGSAVENSRGCTMLTAREMAELVHGNSFGKGNDSKLPQARVTSKVTNWIQKQKDKRKPIFFIGDAPSFFVENSKQTAPENNLKQSRKSRRSLSLTSVREGEVSTNCTGNLDDSVNQSVVQLNSAVKIDNNSLKDNDHKSLFIKRASSSCSNRGSSRRKTRQGSPIREEKDLFSKNSRNQVDGTAVSWSSHLHSIIKNSHEPIHFNNDELSDAKSDFQNPCKNIVTSEVCLASKSCSLWSKNAKSYIENELLSKSTQSQSEKNRDVSEYDFLHESSIDSQNSPSSLGSDVTQLQSSDENKSERTYVSKKLLNLKHLSRALSLHSLKKKTKENSGESSSPYRTNLEPSPIVNLAKWVRGSKRKAENSKYGSLRKSLSYCELTVRGVKVTEKLDLPLNLLTNENILAKPSSKKPSTTKKSNISYFPKLSRSVSLYDKFPLSRTSEFDTIESSNDALARLCFFRLYHRNCVPPFMKQLKRKNPSDKLRAQNKHLPHVQLNNMVSMPLKDMHRKSGACDKSTEKKRKSTPDKNEAYFEEQLLNCNEVPLQADAIMGLGNNHVLEDTTLNMVEEFMPFENSTDKTPENHLPIVMNKHKAPILRLRSRATSRSERQAKGKSTSEISGRPVRKTVSDSTDSKKRPTSQFYDLDFEQVGSNGESIFPLSHVASGSQPILSEVDELTDISATSSNLITRYNLSLHTSTPQLSPSDSLLQRFRKSFALRFQKKKTVSSTDLHTSSLKVSTEIKESNGHENNSNSHIPIELHTANYASEQSLKGAATILEKLSVPQANCPLNDLPKNSQNDREKRSSPNNRPKEHSNPPNIEARKRNKRADWRMSLVYDSVDSVFDPSNKNSLNKTLALPVFSGSDANILQKRTASSDISSKSKAVQLPVSVTDSLTAENNLSPCTKSTDGRHDLTRTASDTTSSEDQQKNISSLDQIWRANPIKVCRAHSRLLMSKQKGRYRLRRSISQPVELEMTGSVHNLRECTRGSADHDSFQKGSLSSDDEASSESDIYHSHCCSPSRRSNTCWELSGEGSLYAEAIWDHETLDSEELPFLAGDIIEVTDRSDQDWWWGTKDGQGGWFPSAFVRLYVSHRTSSLHFNGERSENSPIPYSPSKVNISNLSCEQVRANIVQEIVATEKDYVKHLKDVVEGYLKQVHRRPDMFSKDRIETVFGNIREIYSFQSQFLKQLEQCLVEEAPHLSQIGNCFLNHKEEFKMYSQYCNNHPLAVSELQELYCDSQYIHFFEACRLLQEMIDISLDGFLLTPIQRICKYPLQLAELLKFTDESHSDHVPVKNALAAMREVAELVNERKRRMECLERIAEWQNTIEGWEGPDVLDTSSILIHCGEVTRVSSSWSRDIYLFIFDHQLIYCKKDLLKRQTYAYKGRLNLDYCDIVDVEDGKDPQFAVSVKNAWKIYSRDKDKWYLFYAKTSPEKDQWLHAFKTERQRVVEDEKQAFVVTEEAKKSARLAVLNKQKPKRPRAKFSKGRRCHPDVAVTEILLDSPSAKARSGSLPSNIHPELAIMAGAKLGPTRKKGSGWFHFGSGKKSKS